MPHDSDTHAGSRHSDAPGPDSDASSAEDHCATASTSKLVLFGFLAVAVFFLIAEHRAHFFGVLPYLFLLACPLMHMFGHHGHGGHAGHGGNPEHGGTAPQEPPPASGSKQPAGSHPVHSAHSA